MFFENNFDSPKNLLQKNNFTFSEKKKENMK